jgi:hypothetical protein
VRYTFLQYFRSWDQAVSVPAARPAPGDFLDPALHGREVPANRHAKCFESVHPWPPSLVSPRRQSLAIVVVADLDARTELLSSQRPRDWGDDKKKHPKLASSWEVRTQTYRRKAEYEMSFSMENSSAAFSRVSPCNTLATAVFILSGRDSSRAAVLASARKLCRLGAATIALDVPIRRVDI